MAKIVQLPRSISAPSALDLYGRLLTWPARELVPLAALPGLQSDIEASLGRLNFMRSRWPLRRWERR